jgi:hypothetical protein
MAEDHVVLSPTRLPKGVTWMCIQLQRFNVLIKRPKQALLVISLTLRF